MPPSGAEKNELTVTNVDGRVIICDNPKPRDADSKEILFHGHTFVPMVEQPNWQEWVERLKVWYDLAEYADIFTFLPKKIAIQQEIIDFLLAQISSDNNPLPDLSDFLNVEDSFSDVNIAAADLDGLLKKLTMRLRQKFPDDEEIFTTQLNALKISLQSFLSQQYEHYRPWNEIFKLQAHKIRREKKHTENKRSQVLACRSVYAAETEKGQEVKAKDLLFMLKLILEVKKSRLKMAKRLHDSARDRNAFNSEVETLEADVEMISSLNDKAGLMQGKSEALDSDWTDLIEEARKGDLLKTINHMYHRHERDLELFRSQHATIIEAASKLSIPVSKDSVDAIYDPRFKSAYVETCDDSGPSLSVQISTPKYKESGESTAKISAELTAKRQERTELASKVGQGEIDYMEQLTQAHARVQRLEAQLQELRVGNSNTNEPITYVTAGCLLGSSLTGTTDRDDISEFPLIDHNLRVELRYIISKVHHKEKWHPYEMMIFAQFERELVMLNGIHGPGNFKILYHLPMRDYILSGMYLLLKSKMTLEDFRDYKRAVELRARAHESVIRGIAKQAGVKNSDCKIGSPFDNINILDVAQPLIKNEMDGAEAELEKEPEQKETELVAAILEELTTNEIKSRHNIVWNKVLASPNIKDNQPTTIDDLLHLANAVMIAIAVSKVGAGKSADFRVCSILPADEKPIQDEYKANLEGTFGYVNNILVLPKVLYEGDTMGNNLFRIDPKTLDGLKHEALVDAISSCYGSSDVLKYFLREPISGLSPCSGAQPIKIVSVPNGKKSESTYSPSSSLEDLYNPSSTDSSSTSSSSGVQVELIVPNAGNKLTAPDRFFKHRKSPSLDIPHGIERGRERRASSLDSPHKP